MRGDLVFLSPIGEDDYPLMGQWMASPMGTYANGGAQLTSPHKVKELLDSIPVNYLMIRTHDGNTIGAVNWQQMSYPGHYMIGVAVGDEKIWGAGFGMEATLLLVEYLFHAQNAHRLHLLAGLHNLPIIKLYLTGLVHIEGVMRDYFFIDGEYHDAVVGSMLRDEFYQMSDRLGIRPRDVIPQEDKREARKLLAEYLAGNPITVGQR